MCTIGVYLVRIIDEGIGIGTKKVYLNYSFKTFLQEHAAACSANLQKGYSRLSVVRSAGASQRAAASSLVGRRWKGWERNVLPHLLC